MVRARLPSLLLCAICVTACGHSAPTAPEDIWLGPDPNFTGFWRGQLTLTRCDQLSSGDTCAFLRAGDVSSLRITISQNAQSAHVDISPEDSPFVYIATDTDVHGAASSASHVDMQFIARGEIGSIGWVDFSAHLQSDGITLSGTLTRTFAEVTANATNPTYRTTDMFVVARAK